MSSVKLYYQNQTNFILDDKNEVRETEGHQVLGERWAPCIVGVGSKAVIKCPYCTEK